MEALVPFLLLGRRHSAEALRPPRKIICSFRLLPLNLIDGNCGPHDAKNMASGVKLFDGS
jgi:hypothetical protein